MASAVDIVNLALARLGAAGHNIKHLFVDEGFVFFDSDNIARVGDLLRTIKRVGSFRSILIISHLQAIQGFVDAAAAPRLLYRARYHDRVAAA